VLKQTTMKNEGCFPDFITKFPLADIPLNGLTAYLAQGNQFQLLFFRFEENTTVPEHSHQEQLEIVLEGTVDMTIDGKTFRYGKGDRMVIPAGVPHSAFVHAGYCSVALFNQADRYAVKPSPRPGYF